MKPVIFHPLALLDAEDAMAWYSLRSERAADAFLAELARAVEDIAEAPGRWPRHDRACRRRVLRRFPYIVLFRDSSEQVDVLAVAHGRRRPGYWRRRG